MTTSFRPARPNSLSIWSSSSSLLKASSSPKGPYIGIGYIFFGIKRGLPQHDLGLYVCAMMALGPFGLGAPECFQSFHAANISSSFVFCVSQNPKTLYVRSWG